MNVFMAKAITVLGEIDADELGFTTMHEHTISKPSVLSKILLKSMPDMIKGINGYMDGTDIGEEAERRNAEKITGLPEASVGAVIKSMRMPKDNPYRKLSDIDYYTKELEAFKEIGGSTLVDCSPLPFPGISPGTRKILSERTGIHIIVPAGYYVKCSIPKKDIKKGEAWMQERVENYLDVGDRKSGVKPGFVKCAVSAVNNGAIAKEEMMAVRACAFAAKNHGMCLHIHTAFPVRRHMLLELADMLVREIGIAADRVIFCHMDSYNLGSGNPTAKINKSGFEIELPAELAKRGFHIGLDTWGGAYGCSEEAVFHRTARVEMLKMLVDMGFTENITLGHDMMNRASGVLNHGGGYTCWPHLIEQMEKDGILSRQVVEILTKENPKNLMAIK